MIIFNITINSKKMAQSFYKLKFFLLIILLINKACMSLSMNLTSEDFAPLNLHEEKEISDGLSKISKFLNFANNVHI